MRRIFFFFFFLLLVVLSLVRDNKQSRVTFRADIAVICAQLTSLWLSMAFILIDRSLYYHWLTDWHYDFVCNWANMISLDSVLNYNQLNQWRRRRWWRTNRHQSKTKLWSKSNFGFSYNLRFTIIGQSCLFILRRWYERMRNGIIAYLRLPPHI